MIVIILTTLTHHIVYSSTDDLSGECLANWMITRRCDLT